jgi:hypothetical protein
MGRYNLERYDPTGQRGYATTTLDLIEEWLSNGATLETPKVKRLLQILAETMRFNYSLSRLRKAWLPRAGKGSQMDEIGSYRMLAEATLKHCDKVQKEFDEYAAEEAAWMAEHERKEAEKKTAKKKKRAKKRKAKKKQVAKKAS